MGGLNCAACRGHGAFRFINAEGEPEALPCQGDPRPFYRLAWAAGLARAKGKQHYASTRALAPDYHCLGLLGEAAFAAQSGLPLDLSDRVEGDGGVDFRVPNPAGPPVTINVKTSRKMHLGMLVEQSQLVADIYVAVDCPEYEPEMLGWASRALIAQLPLETYPSGQNYNVTYFASMPLLWEVLDPNPPRAPASPPAAPLRCEPRC